MSRLRPLHVRMRDLLPEGAFLQEMITVAVLRHNIAPESDFTVEDIIFDMYSPMDTVTDVMHNYLMNDRTVESIKLYRNTTRLAHKTKLEDLLGARETFLSLIAMEYNAHVANDPQHLSTLPTTFIRSGDSGGDQSLLSQVGDDNDLPPSFARQPLDPAKFQLNTKFCDKLSIQQLERCSRKALYTLRTVQSILEHASTPEAQKVVGDIHRLQIESLSPTSVTGLFGNMGTGKSALINALLEVARLLPTSSSRACTAAAIEIEHCNDSEWPYKAEIIFYSREEWSQTLKFWIEDLINEDGKLSTDCKLKSTDAGSSYAQLKLLYPDKLDDFWERAISDVDLAVEELLLHDRSRYIGKIAQLKSKIAEDMHDKIERFADARYNNWPFVKVIRLFAKARILGHGGKIVDLAGLHDRNRTRATMAEAYLKKCTQLWIITPITRAVDDQAAQELLDASMRLQIKMDGTLESATLICTKTDDMTFSESSLEHIKAMQAQDPEWYQEFGALASETSRLKEDIKLLKLDRPKVHGKAMTATHRFKLYTNLLARAKSGDLVHEPTVQELALPSRKETSHQLQTEDDSVGPRNPMSVSVLQQKLNEAVQKKESLWEQHKEMGEQLREWQARLDQSLPIEYRRLMERSYRSRVKRRNNESRDEIKANFQRSMEDLEDDPDAKSAASKYVKDATKCLEVFCVSSKTYQILQGRMQNDALPKGFDNVNDTEIPQLYSHYLSAVGETSRAAYKRFLTRCFEIMNALCRWIGSVLPGAANIERSALDKERRIRCAEQQELCKDFGQLAISVGDALAYGLDSGLKKCLGNPSLNRAKEKIPDVIDNIFETCHFQTIRAVCRRGGTYEKRKAGALDYNANFTFPMLQGIATSWAIVFGTTLPNILKDFETKAAKLLSAYHAAFEKRQINASALRERELLQHQMENYHNDISDIVRRVLLCNRTGQIKIQECLKPIVVERMEEVYNTCIEIKGKKSTQRMKENMEQQTADRKVAGKMFKIGRDAMKKDLEILKTDAKKLLIETSEALVAKVGHDYNSTECGQSESEKKALRTPEYSHMCNNVNIVLHTVQAELEHSVTTEVEDEAVRTVEIFRKSKDTTTESLEVVDMEAEQTIAADTDNVDQLSGLMEMIQGKRSHNEASGDDGERGDGEAEMELPADEDEWLNTSRQS